MIFYIADIFHFQFSGAPQSDQKTSSPIEEKYKHYKGSVWCTQVHTDDIHIHTSVQTNIHTSEGNN